MSDTVETLQQRIKELELGYRKKERELVHLQEAQKREKNIALMKADQQAAQTTEEREGDKFLRLLMENSYDLLLLLDQEGRLSYCTKTFLEFLHVSDSNTVIGKNFAELSGVFTGSTLAIELKEALEKAVQKKTLVELTGTRFLNSDNPHEYTVAVLPMINPRREYEGAMLLFHDVTEIEEANRNLKAQRDAITIMQDNLKAGIFLMDKDFVIQGNYSAALEEILVEKDLAGKYFTDLLSFSFSAKEMESVRDYFTMVVNRLVSASKLDSMNPMDELNYVSVTSRQEKTLRCEFASIDQGSGQLFILATITDISRETLLQKQLQQEQQKRESEMRSLFEVIQLDPAIFSEFMSDVVYNSDRITAILKNKDVESSEALIEIYQLVHAIKSDAYILGLEDFGGKLHDLESEIKKLQQDEDTSFSKMLHLVVGVENILAEQDKLEEIIGRIRNFDKEKTLDNVDNMMLESFRQACARISQDLNKQVRFSMEAVDPELLQRIPRREVKEIIIQLIRNAIYHGIELPDERAAKGKDPTGVIDLSMQTKKSTLKIVLKDDGRGLDFNRISEKAERQGLIQKNKENKTLLAQVIFMPGFSTSKDEGAHAGRGMGLSLVRARVKDLHGEIKLQSRLDQGTTFTLLIPFSDQ
ncbi:ATP-binding protein [Leadbettera azotonutricia]|uniref:histidine kinase n=1 Tax=Leadbettera azotonutricia (strain ATCC BAA-888 / DSM 13862 / ZAS-9) TaxID=545695 RepID=F5YFS6_LEAAZ|nr:ATP-binding protein [Leadbettera azotonutricia]AEF80051.1 PAS domain protein [Leadbettera azotonutricia ZAS-9]